MIHTCIGADETVASLCDEHVIAADDTARFLQDDFDDARIFFLPSGDVQRFGRRLYSCKTNERGFGLRDDFLSDDQDVAVFERDARSMRRGTDAFGKVFPTPNFWDSGNSKQAQACLD